MSESASTFRRILPAALAVAGVYAYFLLFPQFAFLHALRERGESPGLVRALMGVMAAGGVAGSFFAGRGNDFAAHATRMKIGAFAAALAGGVFAFAPEAQVPVAALSGFSLGLLTVSLAASLRDFAGVSGLAPACGLGTGLAYAAANLPPVFNAAPAAQALMSAGLVLAVPLALAWRGPASPGEAPADPPALSGRGFRVGVTLFLLLIWLDSACFAVIQETASLRRVSWSSDADLYANALIHAAAAFATGFLFRRNVFAWLAGALAALIGADLLLTFGGGAARFAHEVYAAGVSVYSALLVAWLPAAHGAGCAPRVARLYAVAGWLGSALGVGMALDLHRIPVAFPVAAAGVFAAVRAFGFGESVEGGLRRA